MTDTVAHQGPSRRRAVSFGFLGLVLFNIVYITILLLASRVTGSLDELLRLWPWGLAVGSLFGVQVGLFAYVRQVIRSRKTGFGKIMAVSGTGSVGSMVACCTHLIALFVPLLGVSLLSGFLVRIQGPLIFFAIFINLFAIATQLIMMKNHGVYHSGGSLAKIKVEKLKTIRIFVIAATVPVMIFTLSTTLSASTPRLRRSFTPAIAETGDFDVWGEKADSNNSVTVTIKPLLEETETRLGFTVTFETHTVDLNFNIEDIAKLRLDDSTTVTPIAWDGPGPGGHHVSGTLWFPGLPVLPDSLRLELADVAGIDRVFEWN